MKRSLTAALVLLAVGDSTNGWAENVAGIFPSECDSVADNLVDNCGFETGGFPPWQRGTPPCFCSVTERSRSTGIFGLEYGTVELDQLYQPLATTPGQQYTLSFWLRNINDTAPLSEGNGALPPNLFRVYWEGDVVYELADVPEFPWTQLVLDGLLATQPTSVLAFGFYNPVYWWFLDDVVLVPSAK